MTLMMIVMMSNHDFPDISHPYLLLRTSAIISSIFWKVKSWIFFRQGKFQGQLTKVLANGKVNGQRSGQKSKSILDVMQFDPHQRNVPILCNVWIYLKPNVCICIIAGERKRLTSIQTYPSVGLFSHFIGEENQEKM